MARDFARFLQPTTPRERVALGLPAADDQPVRIGPAEFSAFGRLVAVRCPSELAPLMQKAGGQWEPGSRRWLIKPRRLGPLIRNLQRATDPLFRRAGMSLDEEG
jgi:hypothetical protein